MKSYELLQSNLGQTLVGVNTPDVSAPEIPFIGVEFDNRALAVAGIVALGAGAVALVGHKRNTNKIIEETEYPAGSDVGIRVEKAVKSGRRRSLATGLVAVGALSTGLLNEADPYTSETTSDVDRVSVIIDAGYEAYAKDITNGNGELVARLPAIANTIKDMELDGITVDFVAAGTEPLSMGSIEDGNGTDEVVENFNIYIRDLSNKGNPNNGGGDIETALSIAESTDPDKVLIFTGSLEGQSQSPLFEGQDIEGNRQVSVIAVGTPGAQVETLAGTYEAPINTKFNQEVVGAEDSYTTNTTEGLEEIVENIISDQYVSTTTTPYKGYEKLRNLFGALLIAGVSGSFIFRETGGIRKFINRKNK